MNRIPQFLVLLSAAASFMSVSAMFVPSSKDDQFQEYNLTTVQIIEKYGYPAETHRTETEDGYILEMHRIPHGKNTTAIGYPVLVQHGLFSDSTGFVLSGENSLAFLLSDAGHDVWLTNSRGTVYTDKHKTLSNRDSRFWDFSFVWHESGIYDLPAQIDYVCEHTQKSDVLYVAHSMGTTEFFVMASDRPQYQKKVKGAFMMAPVAYLKHTTSPLRHLGSKFLQSFTEMATNGQFFKQTPQYKELTKVLCTLTVSPRFMCKSLIFMVAGFDGNEFDERALRNFMAHTPSSASSKPLVHYGQLTRSGKFCQYDYGMEENMVKYNQSTPPDYKLENVKTPLAMFIAKNDVFVKPKDFLSLLKRLSSVKSIDVASYAKFSHLDFLAGKHAKEYILDKLIQRMDDLLKRNESANIK